MLNQKCGYLSSFVHDLTLQWRLINTARSITLPKTIDLSVHNIYGHFHLMWRLFEFAHIIVPFKSNEIMTFLKYLIYVY